MISLGERWKWRSCYCAHHFRGTQVYCGLYHSTLISLTFLVGLTVSVCLSSVNLCFPSISSIGCLFVCTSTRIPIHLYPLKLRVLIGDHRSFTLTTNNIHYILIRTRIVVGIKTWTKCLSIWWFRAEINVIFVRTRPQLMKYFANLIYWFGMMMIIKVSRHEANINFASLFIIRT